MKLTAATAAFVGAVCCTQFKSSVKNTLLIASATGAAQLILAPDAHPVAAMAFGLVAPVATQITCLYGAALILSILYK